MSEWKAYADNKTCYVLKNGELVEAFKVGKREGGGITTYFRHEQVLDDRLTISDEERRRIMASLSSMKQIAHFGHRFFYVREFGMDMNGLGKRMENAGEIADVQIRSAEEAEDNRRVVRMFLEEAQTYLSVNDKETARQLILEGLKYDPDNSELKGLLCRVVKS